MNKKYHPFGKNQLMYGIFFILVIALMTFVFIKTQDTLRIILVCVLFLIVAYYFISPILIYSVKIKGNKISMKKDFGIFKEDRIQKKTEADLTEVKEYMVIMSDRDSEGQPYQQRAPKKKYIELIMNDDTKKRFYVSNMSDKQLKKIISDIKEITGKDIKTSNEDSKIEEERADNKNE